MKSFSKILFSAIFIAIIAINAKALLSESLFVGGARMMQQPWAVATLVDAYCGFLTFYAWVFYKEASWLSRILWFVLIMGLGNIVMSAYMLWQLYSLPSEAPLEQLLLRKKRT